MKVLVTGGAGFIGSNFILYWSRVHPDDEIINYDALTYAGNLENLLLVKDNPHYSFIQGNICDKETISKAMDGVDIVIHFAAESHVDRSIKDPSLFIQSNIFGTYILLEEALRHQVKRFHHISTDEVFGALTLTDSHKFSETTPYNPRSPYAASKASSDHLVRAYHETYGLPVTISNCSNNFGPYQFPEKLIPLAITNLIEGKKVPVYGDGLYIRDWIYVDDHNRAVDLILQNGKIGETYCIGGMHEEITNLDIVKKIIKLLDKSNNDIEFIQDRPGHDRRYAVDWTKMQRELHWSPEHSFDEWLEKTVHWYLENNKWWQRVKSGEYLRFYQEQYGEKG